MPEILQFHCPACGITLRIPTSAAGTEGPCPRCAQTICAPDPVHHLPPRRLSPPGSIHAMMERISRARAEAAGPVQEIQLIRPEALPVAADAPEVDERPAVPPAPLEPVAVKYPPFDPPPQAPPVEPEPEPVYYPWHELAAAAAAAVAPVVAEPAPSPAPPPPRPEPPATVLLTPQQRPEPAAPPKTVAIEPPAILRAVRETIPAVAAAAVLPSQTTPVVDRTAAPFSRPLGQIPHIAPVAPQILTVGAPAANQRAVLLLSCGVTGILTLLAGFAGGYYAGNRFPLVHFQPAPYTALPAEKQVEPKPQPQPAAAIPPPEKPAPDAPPVAEIAATEATPQAAPPADAAQPPASSPAPAYDIPAELDSTIRGFLAAPSRAARIRYVLSPDRTRPKMEAWYSDHTDSAFPTSTFVLDGQLKDRVTGQNCIFFTVFNERHPTGIPLITMDTPDGWRVDWESFNEFHEDAFGRFCDRVANAKGRFHLYVRNVSYFGERFPGIEKLTAFRIDPPLPDRIKYAFVVTGSEAHKALAALTDDGTPAAAILDLTMREPTKGHPYIEISAVAAPDWMPR